jgi:hypothetical protein
MLSLANLKVVESDWLKSCTLNQKEAAARLEITERYLRELDEYYPPRARSGSGFESEYTWPAVLFWWFEFQIARTLQKRDDWAFQNWWDKAYYMRQHQEAERKLANLVVALEKTGVSPAIIKSARRILSFED